MIFILCILYNSTCFLNSKYSFPTQLGQNYTSRVKICEEKFPTRSYEELTLGAGVYDAIIIELGSGEGDNWWCVAYPPYIILHVF